MQKILQQQFESSSGLTPQWQSAFRQCKKYFRDNFSEVAEKIELSRGHFYFSGFLTRKKDGQIFYFSISDVRHFTCDSLLIRTAEHYKDWTGGSNQSVRIDENFKSNLINFLQ